MTQTSAIQWWLDLQWAQAPRSFDVDVDGAPIACRGWNLDATHLPGIVLVHGFRAHAHWWDHIAPSFADRYRVVALSLSGMGDSGRRERYSRGQFARDILGVAAACGFSPMTIIAHSFGSMGALLAAKRAPEQVQRLIMIDAGIQTDEEPDHQIPVFATRVYPTRDEVLGRFRLLPQGAFPDPAIRDYVGQHSVKPVEGGWTWKFDEALPVSMNQDVFRDEMRDIPVPVDIVLGELTSIMTPPRLAAALVMCPQAGLPVVVPASEHHVMIEQPIALISALRGLLANPR